jgi:hypothetical protein
MIEEDAAAAASTGVEHMVSGSERQVNNSLISSWRVYTFRTLPHLPLVRSSFPLLPAFSPFTPSATTSMGAGAAVSTSAGNAAYKHLLDPNRTWYNNGRLMRLNAWIFLMLLSSYYNGYDGSMMNGLQSLDQWEDYFNHPTGGTLGLFNAIQVSRLRCSKLLSTVF